MNIFSLVVAREGSKAIKNKTLQDINGKYLFEYSVEYSLGLAKKLNAEVLTAVSSDLEVIEKYCLDRNILFIERRPELALDTTKIEDVIFDAYEKAGKGYKYISLLYSNIPTRYPDEFMKAFDFLEKNPDYDAALSMQNAEKHNPGWMFELNDDMIPRKEEQGYRRQDLKQCMFHDGHTVLLRSGYFIDVMKKRGSAANRIMFEAFGRKIKPILNNRVMIDIDTEKDLELAKGYLR